MLSIVPGIILISERTTQESWEIFNILNQYQHDENHTNSDKS